MTGRTHRFVSSVPGMALAVAVVATSAVHQHARQTIVGAAPQHGVSATTGQPASAMAGSAISRVNFTPFEFHHF